MVGAHRPQSPCSSAGSSTERMHGLAGITHNYSQFLNCQVAILVPGEKKALIRYRENIIAYSGYT